MILIIENTDNKYLVRWSFQTNDHAPMMLSAIIMDLGEEPEFYRMEDQGFYIRLDGEQVIKLMDVAEHQEQNEGTKTFLREFGYLIDAPSE